MQRPRWITTCSVLLLVSALLEPLQIGPARLLGADSRGEWIGLGVNLLILGSIAWFLWKRHYWACILAFVFCAMCLLELKDVLQPEPLLKRIATAYDGAAAIFILAVLTRREVYRWYRGKELISDAQPGETS